MFKFSNTHSCGKCNSQAHNVKYACNRCGAFKWRRLGVTPASNGVGNQDPGTRIRARAV